MCAIAGVASAASPLTTGFFVGSALSGETSASQDPSISDAGDEGAGIVRIDVFWASAAPAEPAAGFDASDPSSPGYNWAGTDAAVRDLTRAGLKVMITVQDAPTWAQGPDMPSWAIPGTWDPSPADLAAFATAAARRYSGTFPDPLNPGATLPAVRIWQPWNEPNLDYYLSPQRTQTASGYVDTSPGVYRSMLDAFYTAVKSVSSSNFVVMAGTAPYGDQAGVDLPGQDRMPPVEFDRGLFCEADNARLTATSCSSLPELDAVDHHPYEFGGPLSHAQGDDAGVPDMYKIANVLNAAEREHHVLPAGPKQFWDTEISWDTNPPDPDGVAVNTEAKWVEQADYVLWKQGVDTVLWLRIVDAPPIPSYASTYQSGVYYLNGTPKPSATSFRFPFVTVRPSRKMIQAWGRAPQGGRLRIEVRRGRRWKLLKALKVKNHQVFLTTIALRGRVTLRAQIGAQTSLSWVQGTGKSPPIVPAP
jgi:hypothetical protein